MSDKSGSYFGHITNLVFKVNTTITHIFIDIYIHESLYNPSKNMQETRGKRVWQQVHVR